MTTNRVGILDLGTKTFAASATITEMNLLSLDAAGDVVEATDGTSDPIIGASIRGAAGAAAALIDVQLFGICEVIASAAVNEGAQITAAAGGKAVTAAPGAGVNSHILGIALTAAAADGDVIFVQISPQEIQG